MKRRFESDNPLESDQDFSLTIVQAAGCVALGRKTRGFGRGKLVLPGGAELLYQNRAQNAVREVEEELGCSLNGLPLHHAGTICVMDVDEMEDVTLHLSRVELFEAVRLEVGDELIDPAWYPEATLPYHEMPSDYSLWLPAVLDGCTVMGSLEIVFDEASQVGHVTSGFLTRQQQSPLGRAELIPIPSAA